MKKMIEMRFVDYNTYENEDGFLLQREEGFSPDGIPFNRRWVLRDPNGNYMGHDQYRNDLAEEFHLNLRNARLTD